jgi:hypothetical protein
MESWPGTPESGSPITKSDVGSTGGATVEFWLGEVGVDAVGIDPVGIDAGVEVAGVDGSCAGAADVLRGTTGSAGVTGTT